MNHSEDLLGQISPVAHVDIQWAPLEEYATLDVDQCRVVEEPPTEPDGPVNGSHWPMMDDHETWDPVDACILFPYDELSVPKDNDS